MTMTEHTSLIRRARRGVLAHRATTGAILIVGLLLAGGCNERGSDSTAAENPQTLPIVASVNEPESARGSLESSTGPNAPQETDTGEKHEYTNRLIDSTSPYLLQHAHNPVDWYPWGEEAIGRAKAENKAIFLSVGYSTCYWCHVMEREVFENPEIAALMNQLFVNVKVDRE
ncbi:MAG: thioredoxin domain-containing protein, partial [Phycisphaerales bacterium]|nr:thioredoxin domain-containing protein [Phycisphaerales bacterium]